MGVIRTNDGFEVWVERCYYVECSECGTQEAYRIKSEAIQAQKDHAEQHKKWAYS
jgi:Zn ribbon nucleic-acid-binding protein